MLTEPMDIRKQFPIRKSNKQKEAFRCAVQSYATQQGYSCQIDSPKKDVNNVIIGDPENAKFLITAHYDTPAAMLFPNLITPCNPVTFILYQIFVVGLYLALSFGVGFGVYFLTKNEMIGFWCGYLLYFAMLALMMFGPANKNNANDNTSGVVALLETARSMPENLRESVCCVLFDLEAAGLVGSASYRKARKEVTENQIVLFPTKKLKRDTAKMELLRAACGKAGRKSITIRDKGFSYYPSDQKNFPFGVGIAAFRRSKWAGLYCSRIHTKKDTILDQSNVNILRAALTTIIGTAANKKG